MLELALGVLLWGGEPGSSVDIWPQWRGPTRDAKVTGKPWPNSIDENHLRQLWRVELGEGYPGPIVSADKVFTVETKNRKEEIVRAFDRQTGKPLWVAQWPGAMRVPFFAMSNGDWVRSTPIFDGESLYVGGMRDLLVCLNAENGKERWRVDFLERYKTPLPAFGLVCSPLIMGAHVYVQAGASFVKLNKKDGSEVWRTLSDEGGMMGSAFSSPVYAVIGGTPQLVVQTRQSLAGIHPEDGKVIWKQAVPNYRGMNILTPLVRDDTIFTSTYQQGSFLYRINNQEKGNTITTDWTCKVMGYMSSPVLLGDHVYLHLQNQRFACLEWKTGKICWTSKPFGKYWSMVAQGDRILALDENGKLLLVQANPREFSLLESRAISQQPTWGHLAIAGDLVFVRELKALTVFQWR